MDYIGLIIFVVVVILKFASENHKAQQQKEERQQRRGRVPAPPLAMPPAPSSPPPPVMFPAEEEPVRPSWSLPSGYDLEEPVSPRPLTLDPPPLDPPPARPLSPPPVPRRFVVSGPASPPPVNVPSAAPVPPLVPATVTAAHGASGGVGLGYLFDEAMPGGVDAEESSAPMARVQLTGLNRDALGAAGTIKRVRRVSRMGNRADLRRAFLLSEILGRPKGY